jgi:hypothetical protein
MWHFRKYDYSLTAAALISLLAIWTILGSVSCSRFPSNTNRRKTGANSALPNASPQKDPLTLPAPAPALVLGRWQRIDTAPGDWEFEFRPDGSVIFTVELIPNKVDRYEGTYHYSKSETMSDGFIVFKVLDGEQLEQAEGYDVKLSEEGDALLIASIQRYGGKRVQWETYRRVD